MRLILLLLTVCSVHAFAQFVDPSNHEAEPIGGTAAVAIIYYRIDFTEEQTEELRIREAELIFSVSDEGKAKLEKVNNITMHSIVDSLMRLNDQIPEFYPKTENGKPVNGIYFMKLSWPNYQPLLQSVPPMMRMSPYMFMSRR